MTHQLNQRELVIDLASGDYHIERVGLSTGSQRAIVGPVDYGWMKYQQGLKPVKEYGRIRLAYHASQPPDVLTWGGGPLAGSRIPGTRRLVFCGYSPLWEGFYISSIGGAAYIMHRMGVDFISIHGRAPQESVLILNHKRGEIHVRLESINPDALWEGYTDPDGNRLSGFYALQQAVFDRYATEYEADWLRVFAVGPASRTTNQGIIGSNQIKKGRISPIDDWAGRGGLGSRLLQHHRITACIFGGDWEDPDLKDSKEIDSYFQHFFGDSMIRVDLGAAEKYRYVPGFMTGGTFGVNMHTVDDKLYSFNYQSIYASDSQRLDQHSNFIIDHYLKQFNEEVIQPKNFTHCGEPCSVACKKYDRIYKKDFEPYQALGPLCGVFDQRAAEQLNHFVDSLGIDAIQIGGTAAWFMELVAKGQIDPQKFGLPPASEMNFNFASQPDSFDVINDSARNANYATQVISMMVYEPAGELFRQGIRHAAQALDELFPNASSSPSNSAVFLSHGEEGSMTPNQYWVPGMLAPMPMMGKYFVYYGLDYQSPRVLGHKCVERMVFELFSENTGICRFHRKWVEAIVDEIIQAHYRFDIDYKNHQFEIARQIYDLDGSEIHFWESERTIDIVWQYLEKWQRLGLDDESLRQWVQCFRQDKWTAARSYWQEIRSGIAEAFAEGSGHIPDTVAPYQAASLDVMVKRRTQSMPKYIASIDQGTTSTRCMIFDHNGRVISLAQKEHRQIFPQPGWVEHDPVEIWEQTQHVIQEALSKASIQASDIAAIGITNQRETTLVWDRHTGKPYYNAIVWQDTRTKEICDQLAKQGGQDRFRSKVGLPLTTYFSGPKIKWILDHIPDVRLAAERGDALFGNIDTWLIWWLTGGPDSGAHVTDVTNASRTMLMNLETLQWDEEVLSFMDIPRALLPGIVPSSDSHTWGNTRVNGPFGAAIPVCGDLGDQQAALVGQACFSPGEAKNTYGTGCFMLLNTGTEIIPSNSGLLTTLAYQFGEETAVYALEGSIAITGALVQWLRDNLGIINKSSDIENLAKTVDDNGGIYFVPAFSGLFAPYWRSDARGVIVGMTRFINKGHIARAALEATAFQTREVLDAMQNDSGVQLKTLKVDGGMVFNDLLMQFQADLLNVPVVRPKIAETTALGAAYAAGLAVGFWDNLDELRSNWQIGDTWQPQMLAKQRESLYQNWLKAVERSFNWVE